MRAESTNARALLGMVTASGTFLFRAMWIDNVVKPLLMRRGMQMHPVIVFFALLGGLGAFGMIGLLIGPPTVSPFVTLLGMYKRDFTDAPATPASQAD